MAPPLPYYSIWLWHPQFLIQDLHSLSTYCAWSLLEASGKWLKSNKGFDLLKVKVHSGPLYYSRAYGSSAHIFLMQDLRYRSTCCAWSPLEAC